MSEQVKPLQEQKMISVVLPIYNEESCAEECLQRVESAMEKLGRPYEVLFVNDGSVDKTVEILKAGRQKNKSIRILNLSRNFGHQMAITAGLDNARGDAIVVLDSDLQDPPEFIPQLVAKWDEGYDVVHAQRIRRHGETVVKKMISAIYYRFLKEVSEISIPVDVGDFRLLSRRAVDAVNSMPERHRYVRGMACWVGFAQTILPYEREPRFAGVPKYSFAKLAKLAFDGVFSFSAFPMRIATYAGGLSISVSLLFLGTLIFCLFSAKTEQTLAVSLAAAIGFVIFFLGGFQLISVGIVGEYIGYLFQETKKRPHYFFTEVE